MTPYHYTLDQALIRVYRQSEDIINYDITALVVELNIFESIATPQITGSLLFGDSASITSLVSFNGTEKLFLALTVGDVIFDVEFYITNVTQTKGENGSTSAVILDFCDKKSFLSNFRRINHCYSGEIGSIIKSIYNDYLNTPIETETALQNINVIIPYLTPLGACKWLCDRATTEFGEPFFLYSTLREGNKFKSLGSMLMAETPFTSPFVYTDLTTNTDVTQFDKRSREILALEYEPEKSIIELARGGALNSLYVNIDPLNKIIDTMTYDAANSFNNKLNAGRLGSNKNMLFDDSFYIDNEEKLLDSPSAIFLSVNPKKMFDKGESYSSESSTDRHLLKVDRLSSLYLLDKQKINIIVPGYSFLSDPDDKTIGKKINVLVKKDKPTIVTTDLDALIDNKHSGEYLIIEARHKFNLVNNYVVSLTLARVASNSSLKNEEIEPF